MIERNYMYQYQTLNLKWRCYIMLSLLEKPSSTKIKDKA